MVEHSIKETLDFEVASRAVAHLGRNLYRTTPPALAEIVANSYDAYATRVDIRHLSSPHEMVVIADDGIGMDIESLRANYVKIGQAKAPVPVPDGRTKRSPMGKKGIGKLAAFSVGNIYTVYTRQSVDEHWRKFSLIYKDMLAQDTKYTVVCSEEDLPPHLSEYGLHASGCIVVIEDLRHSWSMGTTDNLRSRLSRRFYLGQSSSDFELLLDGQQIDLSTNEYYEKLNLMVYFGYSEDEISGILHTSPDTRKDVEINNATFPRETDKNLYDKLVSQKHLKGWLGFAHRPQDLLKRGTDGYNNSNVIVYINGKIADEDLLKNNPDSTYASRYLVGEIVADYLGSASGDEEDVVTSGREGLDNDCEDVRDLLAFVKAVRTKAIAEWNGLNKKEAVNGLPPEIRNDAKYKTWLDSLDPQAAAFNNGVIRSVRILLDEDSSAVVDKDERTETVMALVNGSIEMVDLVSKNKLYEDISDLIESSDSSKALEQLIALMAKTNISEAYSALQSANERIRAIKELEELMKDPAVIEKSFQKLIGENPWIINPAWRALPGPEDESFSHQREAFRRLCDERSGIEKRNFLDILVVVKEAKQEKCTIVELKRNTITPYSKVNYIDIYSQIDRYRRALIQNDPDRALPTDPTEIPAVFIIPSDSGPTGSGHAIEYSSSDYRQFDAAKIKVIPYDKLLTDCKRMFRSDLEVDDAASERPFFRPPLLDDNETTDE